MKTSRALHRADVNRHGVFFLFRLLLVVAVVLASALAGVVAPANAAGFIVPVTLSTAATTPGNGELTITPVVLSETSYTLHPRIEGGTFSGSVSVPVEITGTTAVKVAYTCTAPGSYITLGFGFKGSPILDADALCGAAPVSVWVQEANIALSAPGSGSASVALINTGSNETGVFAAYLDGQEWARFSVPAGATSTEFLNGLVLGGVLEIYGIQDGTASAVTPLDSAVIPNAVPDPGVPISYTGGNWNEAGTGTLYPVAKFTTPDSVYLLVYQDGVRVGFAGPLIVDGTEPVAADVNAPDCGDYDVYFSTTADLSGAIRWSKHVEQAACLVDDGHIKQITYCHATGEVGKYILKESSINSFYQNGHNHHQDGRDIVPAGYTYVKNGQVETVPAQNWDAAGQAIFENHCVEPEVVVPPKDDTSKQIGVCLAVDADGATYEKGMLRVATILAKVGDNFGQHIIPDFDYTLQGVDGHFSGQNWTAENQVLFNNDCKHAVVTPPTTPVTPVEPVTPVVPATPTTPEQPIAEQVTQTERPNLTFETAAAEPAQQYNLWGALALFATAAAIVAVLVYRRRNVA